MDTMTTHIIAGGEVPDWKTTSIVGPTGERAILAEYQGLGILGKPGDLFSLGHSLMDAANKIIETEMQTQ